MILDNDNDRRALMGLLPEAGEVLEQSELFYILKLPFLTGIPKAAIVIIYQAKEYLELLDEAKEA